jgi:hypothetical protein
MANNHHTENISDISNTYTLADLRLKSIFRGRRLLLSGDNTSASDDIFNTSDII